MAANLLEFFDENTHRNYPLADTSSGISTTGGVALPTAFLVALDIVCPAFTDGTSDQYLTRFFIDSVSVAGDHLVVKLAYQPVGESTRIVFGVSEDIPLQPTPPGTYPKYSVFATLTNPDTPMERALAAATGTLYVGTTSNIIITGSYTFDLTAARLHETCIHTYGTAEASSTTGLSSIVVKTASDDDVVIDHDFIIRATDGVTLNVSSTEDGVPVLVISPSDTVEALVNQIKTELGNPIYSISGATPAPNGDGSISLVGNDCVSVSNSDHGLSISNPCAKPCCDDADTQAVSNALQALDDAKNRLEAYYQALATNINTMQARLSSLIAARNGHTATQ